MPFVRKTDSQGSQPPTDTRKLFIGRTGELLFFVQNILKPEEPTHNIISIWGQGGVGKSTLLSRFIDETRSAEFKDYCLTATVDELQTTPASIMEKFAAQLHMQGAFEKSLKHYKEALRAQQAEREMLQDSLIQRMPTFAGAAVEGIPFVGPLLGEGVKATAEHLLDRRSTLQRHRDAKLLEDPVNELTRVFVNELNQLAESQVLLGSKRVKNRRVILFFDTFEQLATEAAPWLLHYFLPADIKGNIVLVIAGRDSIERSIPEDTKYWLPYCDNETIYWIPLNCFTEDETRAYLTRRNITDPDRIATIWQLSQGLPLYLSLLTSNPRRKVDPTADVVANFLRWIPKEEQAKRQLALDASLFSRSFNQDDLVAFTYLPENELPSLYNWLIAQPFVRSQDGRYSYHDLAKELFSRHLYHRSRNEYYATRRILAHHYQQLLEETQRGSGKEVYYSTEWLVLVRAYIYQLFFLPDDTSQIKAIEQVLSAYRSTHYDRSGEIAGMLRELSRESSSEISLHARQVIKHLSQLIGHPQEGRKRLEMDTFLLHTVASEPSFPSELLAVIYHDRGWAYQTLNEHQRASDDFQRALALLDPIDHIGRGGAYWSMGEYQQAIREYTLALELNPSDAEAYYGRGISYSDLKKYQQAINDFEHTLKLNPNHAGAHNHRGHIHMIFKEYLQALAHFEREFEVDPTDGTAYALQGEVYIHLKEYQRAMAHFERALELSSWNYYLYYMRGCGYLWLKDMEQALTDFTRSYEHLLIRGGWMAEWVKMCQRGASSSTLERLEELIASVADPARYYPHVCQGVVHLLREHYKDAIAELEKAIPLPHDEPWDAYFWKGMACASLQRDEEAMVAIEKALEEGLPPVLLAPLHWFEQDSPDFYEKYVVPLMDRYDWM